MESFDTVSMGSESGNKEENKGRSKRVNVSKSQKAKETIKTPVVPSKSKRREKSQEQPVKASTPKEKPKRYQSSDKMFKRPKESSSESESDN